MEVLKQFGCDEIQGYYLSRPIDARALQAILDQGVRECAIAYGRELGVCGVCGRTLTDENSREAGIGPVCAVNMGWR